METEVWLSEFNHTAKEWREGVLNLTKSSVQSLGRKVSEVFVDFVFQMSDGDEIEIAKLFKCLRTSLEPSIRIVELHGWVVVDRVFALLQIGERGLRDRDLSVPLREKGPERSKPTGETQTRKLEFAYSNVHRFRDVIMGLEEMASLALRTVISLERMTVHADKCQEMIGKILLDMSELCESSHSSGFDSELSEDFEDVDDQDSLKELMEITTEELWREFELYL